MKQKDKQIHVRIPDEIYKKLKIRCIYQETSMQDYLANLVSESVGKYSVEEPPINKDSPKRRR